jgi:hypothetical protein
MRARAELIQKRPHLLPQSWPVVCQAMQFQHILSHKAPQLLNRVKPGGVGRPATTGAWRPNGQPIPSWAMHPAAAGTCR